MTYQLHWKPLIITFYWIIQSPWQDWKKWCIMEPPLFKRWFLCQCLCAPNVLCEAPKEFDASQGLTSDRKGIVSVLTALKILNKNQSIEVQSSKHRNQAFLARKMSKQSAKGKCDSILSCMETFPTFVTGA